ncbi:low molecular weight protein tyrosine phosphatase family protein [Rhodovulum bhavnagarense]|nr:hypothetical protein [Rhodovulum bhavnagarense]
MGFHNPNNDAILPPMRVLFVCTANKLRSPTAEDVFRDFPGIEAVSAGTDSVAPNPLTQELVGSADLIFAMETHHRERIRKKYKQRPTDNRIITLYIPDEYERGDPELIALLKDKVEPRLTSILSAS